jgi:hypothetical protein
MNKLPVIGIGIVVLVGAGVFGFQQVSNAPIEVSQEVQEKKEITTEQQQELDFFVGQAISENLRDQVRETDDPSLLPDREVCTGEQAADFACYNTLYKDIVGVEGIDSAFAFLRQEYQTSEYVQAQCHQITHVIGRAAERKFASVFEAYGAGDGFCWSGYYHGVIEAVIADIGFVNLQEQMPNICADIAELRQYSFDHYNCVHGLGHGIMAITQNELFESLESCNVLQNPWEATSCWSGAFMENIMADNRNHFTEYLKPEEPLYPCTVVDTKYKATCYLMQTSYVLDVNGGDFLDTFAQCETADQGFQDICYQSLGRDASGRTVSNAVQAKDICLLGKNYEQQSNCIIGAVKDFISYFHGDTQAKELCSLFEDKSLQAVCSSTAQEYVKVL